jgi:hypothetical protein
MHNHKERETMSEVKKRKFYSSEFNAKVGLEALRGLKTINEIGQEFGSNSLFIPAIAF